MRFDTAPIANYDLSSLRILGSVGACSASPYQITCENPFSKSLSTTTLVSLLIGEPINPEAWRWYSTHVGRDKCSVVDTYWQTETGSHICVNLPGTSDSCLLLAHLNYYLPSRPFAYVATE